MPMVETANRNPQFVRVMGRIVVEGLLPAVVREDRFSRCSRDLSARCGRRSRHFRTRSFNGEFTS